MKSQTLSVTPLGKPRMTQRDKWNPTPATLRYRSYKDELNWLFKDKVSPRLHLVFGIPMPQSWSEKRSS